MSDRKNSPPYLFRAHDQFGRRIGRWAISRRMPSGRRVDLVENSPVAPGEIEAVFEALYIEHNVDNLRLYFPFRNFKNRKGTYFRRCPNIHLLDKFAELGATATEVGV